MITILNDPITLTKIQLFCICFLGSICGQIVAELINWCDEKIKTKKENESKD